jgi:hemerythrin-like domain-containing protein
MTQPIDFRTLGQDGPGFEQPFEMLNACHERVHRMLDLLQRLQAHVQAHGNDAQARQAARDVMRYFDLAAPAHHRDEELHVFPVLLAQDDAALTALVARLHQDHLQMEQRWAIARGVLSALDQGTLQAIDTAQAAALEAFASLYGGHIAAEEQAAYPAASAAMGAQAIAAMGHEMMARRGAR